MKIVLSYQGWQRKSKAKFRQHPILKFFVLFLCALLCIAPIINMPSFARSHFVDSGIEVVLDNYDSEYNPSHPEYSGNAEISVINRSKRTINIPVDYDGDIVSLHSSQTNLSPFQDIWLTCRRQPNQNSKKTISLQPGQKQTLLEVPWQEILDVDTLQSKKDWRWDWLYHSPSPPSPIYIRGLEAPIDPTFVDSVSFWVELIADNQTLRSKPHIVKISDQK